MKLDISVEIPFSRKQVFEVYRDKLTELVPYLPNVQSITLESRTDEGDIVKCLNRWKGGGEIPATIRKFLSGDLLEWEDHAEWNAGNYTTQWRTVVCAASLKAAVAAQGKNEFTELSPTSTRLTINGDFKVDAGKIPGVPRLLGGPIAMAAETFLVSAIKPNLIAVSKGVEQYLRKGT